MQFLKTAHFSLLAVACLLAATCSSSVESQAANPDVTVFEGARLIVGDGKEPIEDSVFVVERNQVRAVGRQGSIEVPAGATRVDLSGKTVMPAKVDMHGHLGWENVIDGTTSKKNFTRENLIDHLQRFAYLGFSAVVSIADLVEREVMPGDHLNVFQESKRLDQVLRLKMPDPGKRPGVPPVGSRMPWGDVPLRVRDEVIPNAALFQTTGPAMSWPGSGAQGHPERNDVMYPVTTVEEARRAVQDYVKIKPAFIKIWLDDRDGQLKKLTPPLYQAIIDEARKFNVDVAAHTVTLEDAKGLYRAGLVGAVHIPVRGGDRPDDELLAIIKDRVAKSDRPLWFVEHGSTAAVGPDAFDDPLLSEILSPDQVQKLREAARKRTPEALERARQSSKETGEDARKLVSAGMKLVYGSDNGSAGRGFGWHEQMKLENWINMGFRPAEAIVMATRDGAQVAGLNTGMVAPGKSADFIVLDANPLDNIANTRRINKVYLRGAEVDRDGLRSKWQAKWRQQTSTP